MHKNHNKVTLKCIHRHLTTVNDLLQVNIPCLKRTESYEKLPEFKEFKQGLVILIRVGKYSFCEITTHTKRKDKTMMHVSKRRAMENRTSGQKKSEEALARGQI
ncbi:hypothetical protein TNCV_78571 [Trichonephila clavipes]|nr:hypothetical protein TNCV_78571 [Trichonephila clavipes]